MNRWSAISLIVATALVIILLRVNLGRESWQSSRRGLRRRAGESKCGYRQAEHHKREDDRQRLDK